MAKALFHVKMTRMYWTRLGQAEVRGCTHDVAPSRTLSIPAFLRVLSHPGLGLRANEPAHLFTASAKKSYASVCQRAAENLPKYAAAK